MTFTFYDNESSSSVVAASQNAILGAMDGNFYMIPGCIITLSRGTWVVTGTFHYRCWQLNTGYAKSSHSMSIADGSGVMLGGMWYTTSVDAGAEQNSNGFSTLTTIVTAPNDGYLVQLRGASSMVAGTNFASGFRWDSGAGQPAQLRAVKVGM